MFLIILTSYILLGLVNLWIITEGAKKNTFDDIITDKEDFQVASSCGFVFAPLTFIFLIGIMVIGSAYSKTQNKDENE